MAEYLSEFFPAFFMALGVIVVLLIPIVALVNGLAWVIDKCSEFVFWVVMASLLSVIAAAAFAAEYVDRKAEQKQESQEAVEEAPSEPTECCKEENDGTE